jgi:uncharacterized protein (DUF2336 family)
MSKALQIIGELEVALKGNSTERHLSILKSVTGLFLAGHDRLTEEVSSVFDGVMVRLIEHVESRARFELSRDVAPIANAPHSVIHRLANDDDIAVAGPVLAQSPRLTDQNLIEIAESKGQSHLSKIAERPQLSTVVTDVLVDRGDREVVTKVAVNTSARLSSTGMSMLAMRASGDDELNQAMTRRSDISPALFKRLLSHATEEARQRMLAAAGRGSARPSIACWRRSPPRPAPPTSRRRNSPQPSAWCNPSARTPSRPAPRCCNSPTAIASPNWSPRSRS